jgi:transmembrane protein
MPKWVEAILGSPIASLLGRVLLTFLFWSSGLSKLVDFGAAQGEMAHFNLHPPAIYAVAVTAVQLIGSALIIWGRLAWLGAGMLAVFTLLTIPIAHNFWTMPMPQLMTEMYVVVEHISVVGALILVSILRWRETGRR